MTDPFDAADGGRRSSRRPSPSDGERLPTPQGAAAAASPEPDLPPYLITSKNLVVFDLHQTKTRRWGAYFGACGAYGILMPTGVPLTSPWITLCKWCFPNGQIEDKEKDPEWPHEANQGPRGDG